ncbi:Fanconi anemia group A protein homolog isoform X1 [Parasteatoda tepidariorum]|uniref:Fanconi anemia group A protein homolog isoform X1 n=1 Tax=Parasteatoda tepidariorum TaxID=114398 RepID=UPI001C718C82|nr:Fanconi anemia group A protein homolog isoform X1 [Parasteatoda tepidariorum]
MTFERHYVDKAIDTFVIDISKSILEYNFDPKCDKLINFIKLCSFLKSSMRWNFNFEEFYNCLLNIHQMRLEVLWNLHIFQILPLEIYLCKLKSTEGILKFSERFCIFCLQDSSNQWQDLSSKTGLMSSIIERAFNCCNENIEEMSELKEVSKTVVENFLQCFSLLKNFGFYQEFYYGGAIKLQAFFCLWTCSTIDVDSLNLFSQFALQSFLNTSRATEIEAFIIQKNWKNQTNPFHLLPVIEKFIETLKHDEIKFTLMQSLFNDDNNWRNFSVIISALSRSTEDKSSLITEMITILLKDGFEHIHQKSLQRALLIGRLITLIKNDSFAASYISWFQTNIGSNLQGRNPEVVSVLLQVLSDLLPYEENIDFIKIMLERPLNVPLECQPLNLDYIVLLKTRVKDLQPKVDTEKIIEKALCYFQETKKIPPYILEASLMNKQHYLNEFLPALLKPRVIASVADTRESFIDFLNKSGKIPNYFYKKYKMSCHEEQQNLIAEMIFPKLFLLLL